MIKNINFDVIVIGGGHAGIEAASAAARLGAKTLLLTQNIDSIGQMSCNPAIGGIGKGHLVREIDALGGVMAEAIDLSGIQFRLLNSSKGPAVRATRAQADRDLYKQAIKNIINKQENLWIFQQSVIDIIIDNNKIKSISCSGGITWEAKTFVLTVGTFLNGLIHLGTEKISAGRAADPASIKLAKKLRDLNFNTGRLKTGTPPRIDSRSIDYTKLAVQHGDDSLPLFSFWHDKNNFKPIEQRPCFITYTNQDTHNIINNNLHLSPMYSGQIESRGPRYCPSIEDKIVRFSDKNSHQIFLEPEGLSSIEIYPNGISTSLPYNIQVKMVRSIEGLENAHITRPGYAIEYDFFDPRDLYPTLQTKKINNLFFAGQINGTTGYEEAAAQGLIAGLNAGRYSLNLDLWYPKRNQAYIGVLIDDLVTLGTSEPYRMFTSRAEYRLSLREDNADLRLTEIGFELGLINNHKWQLYSDKLQKIKQARDYLVESKKINLLKRSDINITELKIQDDNLNNFDSVCLEQIEIQEKYAGYIQRQDLEIKRNLNYENLKLPSNLNFTQISGLSNEIQEKLILIKPQTLGQASRIPGVTPSAISILLIYLKKHGWIQKSSKVY